MTKEIIVCCYKWRRLVIDPGVQHWGYSLHRKLDYFLEFIKTNQAHKILRRAGNNTLIEPYGQPYACWVSEAQYQIIKDSGLGTLHIGKPPEIYEILNDLERINDLSTVSDRNRAGDLDRAEKEKEKHNAVKKEKIKKNGSLIKIDDFKKRRRANK